MNILYVPTKDPRLTNGGNEQRTNLLWESLKRHGKVYTFMADKKMEGKAERIENDHPIYKFKPEYKKNVFWIEVNAILNRLSLFCIYRRNLIRCPNPMKVYQGVQFDIVVSRYVHPLCEYKYWKIAPLFIDVDDHPLQVYDTVRRKRLPFGLKKIGELITKWQVNYLINKAAGGWIANEEQVGMCGGQYRFLPNIPQLPSTKFEINNPGRKNLFTVGAMAYAPNREGVSFFLKEIWPSFHFRYPNVKYFIVGKGASEETIKQWNCIEGVHYLGYVDDLEGLYEGILASVVPVCSGGGTCIKTLETMSFSRSCISTRFGVRGLSEEVLDEEHGVLVFNDSDSFISCFEKIQQRGKREYAEYNGRKYVLNKYSKEVFDDAVDRVINNN